MTIERRLLPSVPKGLKPEYFSDAGKIGTEWKNLTIGSVTYYIYPESIPGVNDGEQLVQDLKGGWYKLLTREVSVLNELNSMEEWQPHQTFKKELKTEVMPWVQGWRLSALLQARPNLSFARRFDLGLGAIQSLMDLHEQQLVNGSISLDTLVIPDIDAPREIKWDVTSQSSEDYSHIDDIKQLAKLLCELWQSDPHLKLLAENVLQSEIDNNTLSNLYDDAKRLQLLLTTAERSMMIVMVDARTYLNMQVGSASWKKMLEALKIYDQVVLMDVENSVGIKNCMRVRHLLEQENIIVSNHVLAGTQTELTIYKNDLNYSRREGVEIFYQMLSFYKPVIVPTRRMPEPPQEPLLPPHQETSRQGLACFAWFLSDLCDNIDRALLVQSSPRRSTLFTALPPDIAIEMSSDEDLSEMEISESEALLPWYLKRC